NERGQKSAASIEVAPLWFNRWVGISDAHYIQFVSANVRQGALQLTQRIVANHQRTLALLTMLDLHGRAQTLGQPLLETLDVRVAFRLGLWRLLVTQPLAYQGFGLPDGQPPCDNMTRTLDLLLGR